jgi:hypothetical protein
MRRLSSEVLDKLPDIQWEQVVIRHRNGMEQQPVEIAYAVAAMMHRDHMTHVQIAENFGVCRSWPDRFLTILFLPSEIQAFFDINRPLENRLGLGEVRILVETPPEFMMKRALTALKLREKAKTALYAKNPRAIRSESAA